jgi:ATP/maltotriose-dependent transcriptional regulator MalT
MTIEQSNIENELRDGIDYEPLTIRELEVMCLYSNPYYEYTFISNKLNITIGTLKFHINNIFDKLQETDRYSASLKFFKLYPQHRTILDNLLS